MCDGSVQRGAIGADLAAGHDFFHQSLDPDSQTFSACSTMDRSVWLDIVGPPVGYFVPARTDFQWQAADDKYDKVKHSIQVYDGYAYQFLEASWIFSRFADFY
jgi:hypothetical protein